MKKGYNNKIQDKSDRTVVIAVILNDYLLLFSRQCILCNRNGVYLQYIFESYGNENGEYVVVGWLVLFCFYPTLYLNNTFFMRKENNTIKLV